MTPQPAAIFFDMDGTILDWQSGMDETWLACCVEHCDGSVAPDVMHAAIRERRTWFWDDTARAKAGRMDLNASAREIVRHAFEDLGIASMAVADNLADDYRARRAESIVPYPGAIETLQAFRERGVRLALITNGNGMAQRQSVERFDLARYFDCVVIEGEFGVGKPDERVFRHALEACGAPFEATWMVGDSLEADIAPAVALGMHAVWVDGLASGLPEGVEVRPHRIVRAISELLPG